MPIKRNNIFKSTSFLKKGGRVLELTDAEIKAYKKGGYIIEEFEDGGAQEPPTRNILTSNLTFVPNQSAQSSFTKTTTSMPKPKYRDPKVVAKQKELIAAGYDIGGADGIWGKKSQAAWEEMNAPVKEKSVETSFKKEQVPITPREQRPTGLTKQVPKTERVWSNSLQMYVPVTRAGNNAAVVPTGTDTGGRNLKYGGLVGDPPPKRTYTPSYFDPSEERFTLEQFKEKYPEKYQRILDSPSEGWTHPKDYLPSLGAKKDSRVLVEDFKVRENCPGCDFLHGKYYEEDEQGNVYAVTKKDKPFDAPLSYWEMYEDGSQEYLNRINKLTPQYLTTDLNQTEAKTPGIKYRPHREWDPATNSYKVMTPEEHRALGRADYKLKTEGPGRIDNTLEGESVDVLTRRKLKTGGVIMELTEKEIADYIKKGLEVIMFK